MNIYIIGNGAKCTAREREEQNAAVEKIKAKGHTPIVPDGIRPGESGEDYYVHRMRLMDMADAVYNGGSTRNIASSQYDLAYLTADHKRKVYTSIRDIPGNNIQKPMRIYILGNSAIDPSVNMERCLKAAKYVNYIGHQAIIEDAYLFGGKDKAPDATEDVYMRNRAMMLNTAQAVWNLSTEDKWHSIAEAVLVAYAQARGCKIYRFLHEIPAVGDAIKP